MIICFSFLVLSRLCEVSKGGICGVWGLSSVSYRRSVPPASSILVTWSTCLWNSCNMEYVSLKLGILIRNLNVWTKKERYSLMVVNPSRLSRSIESLLGVCVGKHVWFIRPSSYKSLEFSLFWDELRIGVEESQTLQSLYRSILLSVINFLCI